MSHSDLESYKVKVERALEGSYRGRRVYTTHAPTSGPVLLHMLNLIEHYDEFIPMGRTGLNVHREVEAMRCTFNVIDLLNAILTNHCVQSVLLPELRYAIPTLQTNTLHK